MIKANDARNIAYSVILDTDKEAQIIRDHIDQKIREAANKGEFKVIVYSKDLPFMKVNDNLYAVLKDLEYNYGYRYGIIHDNDDDTFGIVIDW